MDAAYDALDAAASSYTKSRDQEDDGRSHRSHRDRDYDRDRDRDRDRHRDGERRHRDRDERDDRHRERERDGRDVRGDGRDGRDPHRDRERDRGDRGDRGGRDYRDSRGGGGYERDQDRRRRREDDDFGRAEPMGPGGPPGDRHRDRRPRYDEEPFAAPMRGYDAPPPRHDGGGYGGGGGGGGGYGGGGGGYGGGGGGGGPRDGGFRGRGGGDDWRGGGGGRGGGPRGGGGGGGRRNSPPRSPTPPGTRPLEERHLETSLWDIRPKEFEGIGGMEAKMTGMFTYGPGRVPPPAHLGIPQSLIAGSFPPGDSVNPMRQSKRLYVGGVNDTMNETEIKNRMDAKLREIPPFNTTIEEPIQLCQMNLEKGYAFIEFKTADEASTAIDLLDNFVWDDKTTLRVKRPKDYIGIDPSLGMLGDAGATVAESPNKLFIGGLPTYLNEEQVLELLKSFGEVKSFNLVKDGTESKGFAFAEYNDTETTDMAIAGLHNFNLGDRTLVVQRAAMGKNTGVPGTYSGGYYAASVLANANSTDKPSSRVILLLNMVTADDLYDDQDYNDILEDVNEECGKFGEVEGVRVPRPLPKNTKWEIHDSDYQREEKSRREDERNGVGRVYVMYRAMESAADAIKALAGRQFAGRTILVANVPEAEFLGPAPPPPPAAIEAPPEGWKEEEDGGAKASAAAPIPVPIAVKPKPPPKNIDDAAADALADILG